MTRRKESDPHTPITRHGWPDPERVPWQGDPKWGSSPFGHGGKTIAQWGCPAACLAPLLRLCGFSAGATPQTVVARAMREDPPVWAEHSSRAYLPRLARSTGLSCPDAPTVVTSAAFTGIPVEEMSMLITAHLDALAGFAWLQVDHTDDGVGDHWIGAFAADADWIYAADTATAKIERLDRRTLSGRATWAGREKTYQVVKAYLLGV